MRNLDYANMAVLCFFMAECVLVAMVMAIFFF
jgi:hypothetical protein